ncbi:hypothetical protein QFZ28_003209 [Neobacillus niacini]|nr:hypothetical protein [Neobacillus niacini]
MMVFFKISILKLVLIMVLILAFNITINIF